MLVPACRLPCTAPLTTSLAPAIHHIPQARTEAGVPEGAVRVTDDALAALVEDYARQVGGWVGGWPGHRSSLTCPLCPRSSQPAALACGTLAGTTACTPRPGRPGTYPLPAQLPLPWQPLS